MEQVDLRERWMTTMQTGSDAEKVEAAQCLMALGEHGDPAGTFALAGGKSAFRLGRLAEAVVLMYHGVGMAEPGSLIWAELMVQRAAVCSQHGFWVEAIDAAGAYLGALPTLPDPASQWEPFAHHAMGQAFDRLQRYSEAVPHHRFALEAYPEATRRAHAACDLAYSLALSGQPAEAEQVLSQLDVATLLDIAEFGYWCTRALVGYCLGRFADSLEAADKAIRAAEGNQVTWAVPLAELHFWMSHSAWELGDRYNARAWALRAAVMADQHWHLALRDAASDWLTTIREKGGVKGA